MNTQELARYFDHTNLKLDAMALIEAGADRLGLSAGISILNELKTGKSEGSSASGY